MVASRIAWEHTCQDCHEVYLVQALEAVLDHFSESYPQLFVYVTVKPKGRSEWRECRKDLRINASETNDSILIENTDLDKGSMENRVRIGSQMYLQSL